MDDLADIRDLYNAAWDVEETRLERHQLEADITWRYLDRHLPPAGRLLEIGSGTGAYTFPLARRGYRITAIDLAEKLVTRCQAKADELGLGDRVDFRVGDARDLTDIPTGEFDAVLLMGPLYHLVHEADRMAALKSAHACSEARGCGHFSPDLEVRRPWQADQERPRVDRERGVGPVGHAARSPAA